MITQLAKAITPGQCFCREERNLVAITLAAADFTSRGLYRLVTDCCIPRAAMSCAGAPVHGNRVGSSSALGCLQWPLRLTAATLLLAAAATVGETFRNSFWLERDTDLQWL